VTPDAGQGWGGTRCVDHEGRDPYRELRSLIRESDIYLLRKGHNSLPTSISSPHPQTRPGPWHTRMSVHGSRLVVHRDLTPSFPRGYRTLTLSPRLFLRFFRFFYKLNRVCLQLVSTDLSLDGACLFFLFFWLLHHTPLAASRLHMGLVARSWLITSITIPQWIKKGPNSSATNLSLRVPPRTCLRLRNNSSSRPRRRQRRRHNSPRRRHPTVHHRTRPPSPPRRPSPSLPRQPRRQWLRQSQQPGPRVPRSCFTPRTSGRGPSMHLNVFVLGWRDQDADWLPLPHSSHDKEILEAAYRANPKPDKAARLEIVKKVSLNEKEVQVSRFRSPRRRHRRQLRYRDASMARAHASTQLICLFSTPSPLPKNDDLYLASIPMSTLDTS